MISNFFIFLLKYLRTAKEKNFFSQLLYIFQSEHYDRVRFLSFVYHNLNWFTLSQRGKLIITLRIQLISIVSFIINMGVIFSLITFVNQFWGIIISLVFVYILIPITIVFSDILISPLVQWKKKQIIDKARILVEKSGVKVIGITGSYGKTTMKKILQSILNEQFAVMTLPGNINTDLGIAHFLISHQSELTSSDILIVEMGAYKRGEIKNICEVSPPDYSILTAVAPVHLERFGSLENITKTKWEIVEAVRIKAFVNSDNDILHKKLQTISNTERISEVQMNGDTIEYTYLPEFQGIEFLYNTKKYKTQLIAHHSLGMIALAIDIAKELGVQHHSIQNGVKNIPFISHRLEVIRNTSTGVIVIDDSYNGNFDGFCSGIQTLSRAQGRKIILTPGIVELGSMQKLVHKNLATQYISKNIDLILLIQNSNTRHIRDEFIAKGFNRYKEYKTVFEAHNDLKNILTKGDTILFQNDLSDNYR